MTGVTGKPIALHACPDRIVGAVAPFTVPDIVVPHRDYFHDLLLYGFLIIVTVRITEICYGNVTEGKLLGKDGVMGSSCDSPRSLIRLSGQLKGGWLL